MEEGLQSEKWKAAQKSVHRERPSPAWLEAAATVASPGAAAAQAAAAAAATCLLRDAQAALHAAGGLALDGQLHGAAAAANCREQAGGRQVFRRVDKRAGRWWAGRPAEGQAGAAHGALHTAVQAQCRCTRQYSTSRKAVRRAVQAHAGSPVPPRPWNRVSWMLRSLHTATSSSWAL